MIRSTSLRHGFNNLNADAIRFPHIYDVIKVMSHHISKDSDRQPNDPNDLCWFMSGVASEAEEFMRLRPKFFFITCDVVLKCNENFPELDVGHFSRRSQFIVPVILKDGYYYVIDGRENTPVYRIHDPRQFFFSDEGRDALLQLLAKGLVKSYALSSMHSPDGRHSLYCIPNLNTCEGDGWPSELWSNLEEEEIRAILPFQLVHEPVVGLNQKYSVQVVKLNDTENIVDVRFPNKHNSP